MLDPRRLTQMALFRACLPSFAKHAETGFRYLFDVGAFAQGDFFELDLVFCDPCLDVSDPCSETDDVPACSCSSPCNQPVCVASIMFAAPAMFCSLRPGYDAGDPFYDTEDTRLAAELWTEYNVGLPLRGRGIEFGTLILWFEFLGSFATRFRSA